MNKPLGNHHADQDSWEAAPKDIDDCRYGGRMMNTCNTCGNEWQSDYWETCPHCRDVAEMDADDSRYGNSEDQAIERITQLLEQCEELRKQVNEALKALRDG